MFKKVYMRMLLTKPNEQHSRYKTESAVLSCKPLAMIHFDNVLAGTLAFVCTIMSYVTSIKGCECLRVILFRRERRPELCPQASPPLPRKASSNVALNAPHYLRTTSSHSRVLLLNFNLPVAASHRPSNAYFG